MSNNSSHDSSVKVCDYEKHEMQLLQPMHAKRCAIDGCDNDIESDGIDERRGMEGWSRTSVLDFRYFTVVDLTWCKCYW